MQNLVSWRSRLERRATLERSGHTHWFLSQMEAARASPEGTRKKRVIAALIQLVWSTKDALGWWCFLSSRSCGVSRGSRERPRESPHRARRCVEAREPGGLARSRRRRRSR